MRPSPFFFVATLLFLSGCDSSENSSTGRLVFKYSRPDEKIYVGVKESTTYQYSDINLSLASMVAVERVRQVNELRERIRQAEEEINEIERWLKADRPEERERGRAMIDRLKSEILKSRELIVTIMSDMSKSDN